MTQPAISHALGRLQATLRDELFVRTPDGMDPTSYAERRVGPVRSALEGLDAAFDGAALFDAAHAERGFIVSLGNRTARALVGSTALEVLALPFASPRQVTAMLWHCRLDNVAAHPVAAWAGYADRAADGAG